MRPLVRPADIQIPHSLITTIGLPPEEARAVWHESMGAIYDVRLRRHEDARFQSRAEAYHLGDVVLTAYHCSAQTFNRSRARIGRDGIDHYTLQFCLAGRHGPRESDSSGEAGAGDLLIADLAQRQATATSDFDSLNLTIPRRLLAPLLVAPDEQNLRVISGKAPLASLFRHHLTGLFRTARTMTREEAAAVVGPTLTLAAAVLNAEAPQSRAGVVDPILAAQIRRFLGENLSDPAITPEVVAARFGISRRKLYYLMEPHGGLTAYLREHRLHRAHALLRDPMQRGRSVAEVAQSCGFAWRTNFTRTFRAHFGMTPQEARMLAAQHAPPALGDLHDRHMWDWIRMLR
jgi:AraC-like DNA-binding protein